MALVAVGSNATSPWGDAYVTVAEALKRLEIALGAPVQRSRFYQTPAFPAGAGPDFVNGAAAVQTDMQPAAILAILHEIEHAAQRSRDVRWGQRTLDLDLIACGDSVLPDEQTYLAWRDLPLAEQVKTAPDQLILPHPRLQDRTFVLRPLADIAPDWTHPMLGLTVAQMLERCPQADRDAIRVLA